MLVAPTWLIDRCVTPASARFEHIESYHVAITVERDGTLAVDERIKYDFGSSPHHGIFQDDQVVYRFNSERTASTASISNTSPRPVAPPRTSTSPGTARTR